MRFLRASSSSCCCIVQEPAPGPSPPSNSGLPGSTITFAGSKRPLAAQPVAFLAGAVGAVEGKRPRLQLRNAGAALRARQFLRVQPLLAVDHRHQHQPVGQLGRGIDRRLQPLLDPRLHQQPVHHHFDGMVLALVQRDLFVQRAQHAIDARPHKTLPRQFLQVLLVFALAPAHHRRHHHDAVFGFERQHVLQNLLRGLPRNLVAAHRAVRHPDRRVQQPQVIVDLGDRTDGGARAAAGGLLLDRNRRAQAVDRIHVRPLHLVQKLARVGGKRLHVAPLALGVNRVEGERTFPRSAQARDHGKRVARDLDVDVL